MTDERQQLTTHNSPLLRATDTDCRTMSGGPGLRSGAHPPAILHNNARPLLGPQCLKAVGRATISQNTSPRIEAALVYRAQQNQVKSNRIVQGLTLPQICAAPTCHPEQTLRTIGFAAIDSHVIPSCRSRGIRLRIAGVTTDFVATSLARLPDSLP